MTRILVQRGSASSSSSSNQNRSASVPVPTPSSSSASLQQITSTAQVSPVVKDDNLVDGVQEQIVIDEPSEICDAIITENKVADFSSGSTSSFDLEDEKNVDGEKGHLDDGVNSGNLSKSGSTAMKEEKDATVGGSVQMVTSNSYPPPPPAPPPMSSLANSSSRRSSPGGESNVARIGPSRGESNVARIGPSRRGSGWPGVSNRSSPTGSRPSSPRSYSEAEGYNSADEQIPCLCASYDDMERERQFEIDLRRVKGLEVRKMLEDGNCLFRAVADQVYGDSELYDLVRQMCIDYMERERDHFSQFMTEGFTSYCKRKRRDKVYGNNMEIQAMSEMYNRPIHIYSYSTEPINIFHGSYNTDLPPIRLSYHHGNHYNSLVDPRRLTVGAGLGFSSLQGGNIDKHQVKAAIKAQQDQQIDNALLAEGRFYSDLELTEKEMERMVMDASRAEYIANDKFKQLGSRDSSTSSAEPSSSAARSSGSDTRQQGVRELGSGGSVLSDSMQMMLSMGFSYLQVIEAYSIFGDDVDSMVCYLIETSTSGRRKGKATE